ncbi:MAG: DNA mismatch repair endonuclease MutL [Ignavibacteria bacterium]|nr:DNA mismatch repair endonuclease MutL [Ignavibacteria bacterium]
MGKIKVLSEFLANQIAAGEVVQNPESVVKELVENSLDAGANTICVFLQKSGKTLIQILDDGCGMSKEDLLLAPLRHTTSKLFTSEQLDEIRTFGFRGEALAAISSVSLLEIQTRRAEDEHGWRLQAEPLKEFVVEPINMQVGTQIFVKNLFFNTPARRKFLKTDLTEFKKVDDTLKRIAIAHPDKRFIFYDNNKLIFDAKPAELENRIIELVTSSYSDGNLLKVDKTFANNIKISGYVGQPQLAKTGATTQYLFLNKRPILSKQLSYAVFFSI